MSGLGCLGLSFVSERGVDHDSAAVFTYYDFLVHLDFELTLGRYSVEAAAAGVALYCHDTETVAGVLANALEGIECIGVDKRLELFGLVEQAFLLLTCLGYYLLKLFALLGQDVLVVFEIFLSLLDFLLLDFGLLLCVVNLLLGKFYAESLIFDFLIEKVEFAVVAHIVLLALILRYLGFTLFDFGGLGLNIFFELGHCSLIIADAGIDALYLVFEVFDFVRELAAQESDAVNLREVRLQFV